jgi:hypothetical protein
VNPEHMPLQQLRGLVAQIQILDVVRRHEQIWIAAKAVRELHGMRDLALGNVNSRMRQAAARRPLDDFVGEALVDLAQIAATSAGKHAERVVELQRTLYERRNRINCKECICAAKLPEICSNGTHDRHVIHGAGACIRELRDMFETVRGITASFYARYSTLLPGAANTQVELATGATKHRPHGYDVGHEVGGATSYHDDGAPRAHVKLNFRIEDLRWSSYAALVYVLLHECVVHAFHGLVEGGAPREHADEDDCFAEGWMDLVAWQILCEVCHKPVVDALPFLPDHEREGNAHHEARFRAGDEYFPDRDFGRTAARRFHQMLLGRYGPEEGQKNFWQLSFDLNLLAGYEEDRSSLVEMIHDHTSMPGESRSSHRRERCQWFGEVVDRALREKDARLLLRHARVWRGGGRQEVL